MTQRTALVTGGTGGIGTAIIRYLGRQGHRVATNYRDQAKAEAVKEMMAKEGIEVLLVPGDVKDPDSLRSDGAHHRERQSVRSRSWSTTPASRATPPSTR